MTFQRIENASELPPPGPQNERAREKSDIDFKTWADPGNLWENAKDVAAFANAFGGVLIVGGDDHKGKGPVEYPGLQAAQKGQTFAQVQKIYDDAAKSCSPPAHVDVIPIEVSSGVQVAAVNVHPFIDQALASPVGARDGEGNPIRPGGGWAFPVRRGAQTDYLTPELLPMYMNREIRRTVLLLLKIPPGARAKVTIHSRARLNVQGGGIALQMAKRVVTFVDVDVEKNRVRFLGAGSMQLNVPILDVVDVWESADGAWDVRVTGELAQKQGQLGEGYTYTPLHL